MKKIITMIIMAATLLGTVSGLGVTASDSDTPGGTPITTVAEFLAMKADGIYYLANDLDFSGKTYTSSVYSKSFGGILDGNGHALLGITVSGTNSDAGVFGTMFNGTIRNLTFGSAEAPIKVSSTGGGFSVAAVAGTMTNGATIENVTIYGNIKGDGKTSGITSYVHTGKVTVSNTKVYGTVKGNPASGFFALSNDGSSEITITNSFNYADVTAGGSSAGGFYTVVGSTGGSRSGSLTVTGSANFGDITASDWRAGGIVGEFNEKLDCKLTVDYCYNMGAITMTGSGGFAAGIVGGACFNEPSGTRSISNVYNGGEIKNTANAANAFQIAFANSNSTKVTVKNAAYLFGTPTKNVATTNVTQAATVEELTTIVKGYATSEEGNFFVGTTATTNDGYPILAHEAVDHENVTTYDCGRQVCNDCGKILTEAKDENHLYNRQTVAPDGYADGYVIATCTACGYETVEAGTPSAHKPTLTDGVYQIATGDNLRWYQANLELGLLNGREKLALTADIDLANKDFAPIGSAEHPFCGTLDGGCHKITGLKVTTDKDGGLFGVLSLGAVISKLELSGATVTANGVAGALFGTVKSRAMVKIEWILLNNVTVTSTNAHAGALGGKTDESMTVTVENCIADNATVSGQYAGGFIGLGDSTEMKNCYVNATMTAKGASAMGSLAFNNGGFSQSNCCYVKNTNMSKVSGKAITAESFTNGYVTYYANTLAAENLVGVVNGAIVFGVPTYGVRFGETISFTSVSLDDTGDLEVYTDGKTVAIAVKRSGSVKLPDLTIKLTANGQTVEVKFSELTLTRGVTLNNEVYSVGTKTALYTLSLAGVTAYEIGAFSGTAVTK